MSKIKNWTLDKLKQTIVDQQAGEIFSDLYGEIGDTGSGLQRIHELLLGRQHDVTHLFSAPGRTELGGNHTDHNLGKVLCAAVQNDTVAAVQPRTDGKIIVRSEGFSETFKLDISDLKPHSTEQGKTTALIRGVLAGIDAHGGTLGGFEATMTSNVGVGSGLSSSASFEVLIGTIVNELYNDGLIATEQIARVGQFAENIYFGKPCGLMDQAASAFGGILKIDFANPDELEIQKVAFDVESTGYILMVIHTGSSHADLTDAYASIPLEMKAVAGEMGVKVLRDRSYEQFLDQSIDIRKRLGDRAVLRANHFYAENLRVDRMVASLEAGDFEAYLTNVQYSGNSSQSILQNAIPPRSKGREQGLGFALGLSRLFFEERGRGVARVHGGGFAGAIQAYVHEEDFEAYNKLMSTQLGDDAIQMLHIKTTGASKILNLPY